MVGVIRFYSRNVKSIKLSKKKDFLIYLSIVIAIPMLLLIYINSITGHEILPDEIIISSHFVKKVDVNKKILFESIADVESYPTILPKNVVSIKIIKKTDNMIIAEEEVIESGIKVKLVVKHTLTPYDKHVIEIIEGDAKDTIISMIFEEKDGITELTTETEVHLHGILIVFSSLPEDNLNHVLSTVLDSFVNHIKNK